LWIVKKDVSTCRYGTELRRLIITDQLHLILDLPVLYPAPLTYIIEQHMLIHMFVHREGILMVETGKNCVNALIQ